MNKDKPTGGAAGLASTKTPMSKKKYEEFTKKYEELMSKYKTYDGIPCNKKYEFLEEYLYIVDDNQNTEPIIIIRL